MHSSRQEFYSHYGLNKNNRHANFLDWKVNVSDEWGKFMVKIKQSKSTLLRSRRDERGLKQETNDQILVLLKEESRENGLIFPRLYCITYLKKARFTVNNLHNLKNIAPNNVCYKLPSRSCPSPFKTYKLRIGNLNIGYYWTSQ